MDVYLSDFPVGNGRRAYQVFVNGELYDHFTAEWPLTWSEQWDVAAGYKEALS